MWCVIGAARAVSAHGPDQTESCENADRRPPTAVPFGSSSCTPACKGRGMNRPLHCCGGRGRLLLERIWGLLERHDRGPLEGMSPGRPHGAHGLFHWRSLGSQVRTDLTSGSRLGSVTGR
jgi:hypothetical protein